jgi:hypothetical protein
VRVLALGCLALLLTGCTMAMAQMSPEQMEQMAKVKDAHAGCTVLNTPYGRGVLVWANADRGVLGKVTIETDCKVTIEGPAPK